MFKGLEHSFLIAIEQHTIKALHANEGKLKRIPNMVLTLVYFMCISVLLQGIADVGIKFLGYADLAPQFPWRMDFLFLTAISVLMGYQTYMGFKRREIDVTRNSMQLGFMVELALVVGDIYFLHLNPTDFSAYLPVRAPFIVLTIINILIIAYVAKRLKLFRDKKGNWQFF